MVHETQFTLKADERNKKDYDYKLFLSDVYIYIYI